ncbi:phage tail protein [Gilliamella sp. B3023]|nr:phage tail protein [Gilliamella sp. B3023]
MSGENMETFHWRPQNSSTTSVSPRVKVIKFGDGYEQRFCDGINNDLRSYSVSFVGLVENIDLIENFLTRYNAVKSFLWKEPNTHKTIKVVCRSWTSTVNGAAKTVSATFEEVVA